MAIIGNSLATFELSSILSWLDCLLTDLEVFILFAEINQIILKIYFIPILLTFMYLVALYKKNWVVSNLKSTQTQVIIVTDNYSIKYL